MRFTYSGPPSGATLTGGREVLFHDGKDVDLPSAEENPYVATLVALGYLTPVLDIPEVVKAPPLKTSNPKTPAADSTPTPTTTTKGGE